MWLAIVASFSALYAVLVIRTANRVKDRHLAFLLLALGLRYALSAFPAVAERPLPGGMTPIALSSLAVCAVGLLVVDKRLFQLRTMLPLYIFLAFVAISGIGNSQIGGEVKVLTKFLYVIVLQLALLHALDRFGARYVFGKLLIVFSLPAALQWTSVFLGLDTQSIRPAVAAGLGELDPQDINFIGPYGHESGFSMILLAMMLCIAFWPSRRPLVFWSVLSICVLGVIFANYRTTMLAVFPILLAVVLGRYARAFVVRQRAFTVTIALLVGTFAGVTVLGSSELAARFADLSLINLEHFARSPNLLTSADRDLMSGRLYIWSQYLSAVRNADIGNQLIGFGPESWQGVFRLYAHNTFISFLYEFGYLGVGAFLFYWGANIVASLMIRDSLARLVVFAAYVGFTIMNMATMPIWQVEGLICLAILNGTLMHFSGRTATRRAAVDAGKRRAAESGGQPHATIVLDLNEGRDASRG